MIAAWPRVFWLSLLICMLVVAIPLVAMAQSGAVTLANAQVDSPGISSACDNGYVRDGDDCVPFQLPENAVETRYGVGQGWRCRHGFNEVDGGCESVPVPANGFVTSSGDDWDCQRGYRKVGGDLCEEIAVPEHGFLDGKSYGPGWACDYGYLPAEGKCMPIVVPAGARMTGETYNAGWECLRGYRREASMCVAISVPGNAFLTGDDYGTGWKCERGYRVSGSSCEVIDLPENAHLDYSGNNWACSRPYVRSRLGCSLP